MRILCKKTRRFLIEIQIEQYIANLRKIGIKQEIPLEITMPCPRCHKIEMYEVYENRYVYIGDKNEKQIKKNIQRYKI